MAQFGTVSSGSGNSNSPSRRARSRCWFFTWNNPKVGVAQITNYFSEICVEYVFQLEKGESGTPHYQGVVRYPNPVSNWPAMKCHWERCRNWRQAVKYCSKRIGRIEGPWTNIEGLVFREKLIDPMEGLTWKPWQIEIRDIIRGPVDNRKVYWYWEPKGGVGKSVFTKHLCMNYNAVVCGGTKRDALYAIRNFDEEKDLKIVIFDICRANLNHVSYKAMEDIKNGCFFTSKYESGQCLLNPPHIIVFSNYLPDTGMLSEDRWVIRQIE